MGGVFLELLLVVIVFSTVITQLIIPTLKEQPVFPLFRKSSAKAVEGEIRKTQEELEKAELEIKANELKQQVKQKRTNKGR